MQVEGLCCFYHYERTWPPLHCIKADNTLAFLNDWLGWLWVTPTDETATALYQRQVNQSFVTLVRFRKVSWVVLKYHHFLITAVNVLYEHTWHHFTTFLGKTNWLLISHWTGTAVSWMKVLSLFNPTIHPCLLPICKLSFLYNFTCSAAASHFGALSIISVWCPTLRKKNKKHLLFPV